MTEPLEVKTGVQQQCLLSQLRFLVALDWVTKQHRNTVYHVDDARRARVRRQYGVPQSEDRTCPPEFKALQDEAEKSRTESE